MSFINKSPLGDLGTEESYVPGSCNIGKTEVRRRYRIGFIGLAIAIIAVIVIELINTHAYWKLLLIAPLFYSFSGFIQARNKFCYVYGYMQVFSLKGRRTFAKIRDQEFIKADRRRSFQIVSLVFLSSATITLIYYFLSLL